MILRNYGQCINTLTKKLDEKYEMHKMITVFEFVEIDGVFKNIYNSCFAINYATIQILD